MAHVRPKTRGLTLATRVGAGCVGFETRKVTRGHTTTAATTGTAATMPGSQPAAHHTGIGAGISNMLHPHHGATATQARGPASP